jgi:hypothetical protein
MFGCGDPTASGPYSDAGSRSEAVLLYDFQRCLGHGV